MSYCTLNENVRGNCPTCERELDALRAVARAAKEMFAAFLRSGGIASLEGLERSLQDLDLAMLQTSTPTEDK